jgi:polar amino acid transport system permease protein
METSNEKPSQQPGLLPGVDVSKWPWWAIALALIGLLVSFLIVGSSNYRETFTYLLDGVATTLRITLLSFLFATILGLITGLARVSKNVFFYNISTFYVEVVRGIPLIVLMIYIAFGVVPALVEILNGAGVPVSIRDLPMEVRAIVALAIGYGAYEGEVFRAGIQSISKGQMEAAKSLGMTYFQAMRFVILPQAVRRVLPPLGNDFISLLKDSSLVTVLAVNDLTQLGRLRRASTFRFLETFNVVAFLYLSMTLMLSSAVRWLENKMKIQE